MTVKKIYKYVDRLVEVCRWCEGSGYNKFAFTDKKCFTCNGTGGKWKKVRVLDREEVTE